MSSDLCSDSKKIKASSTPLKISPKPWSEASLDELKNIRAICLDIDDTLSTHGKLTSEAYSALWQLKEAGFIVVPITGRPAGWCDHIARFWPVDAVVGENGAFTFFMEQKIRKRMNTPAGADEKILKEKLIQLSKKIKERFPKAIWASDQHYREYDLAIDICEDVEPWKMSDINELLALCAQEGAHAKLSSIHVNAWFGNYDKSKGFQYWLEQGASGCKNPDQWLYIGDSPNDEPMFASFRYSVGVANLGKYLDRLVHPPTWITTGESGHGFAEMVQKLISQKPVSTTLYGVRND